MRNVLWVLAMLSASQSIAIMPDRKSAGDIKRFGLDKPEPAWKANGPPLSPAAASRLKSLRLQGVRMGFHPQGRISALSGQLSGAQSGTPEQIAIQYLSANRDLLNLDPSQLALVTLKPAAGVNHLLYGQTFNGLPVEFAKVKVHVSDRGEVLGVSNGYIPGIAGSPVPAVGAAAAAGAIAAELGGSPPAGGALVYLPVYATGDVRLAWKFKVSGMGAIWRYYVDAQTGRVIFRYNDVQFACATSGQVTASVYDIDPASTPVLSARPMGNQYVYVYGSGTPAVTDPGGIFCSPSAGKISAALQGPYLSVAQYNRPSVMYDNGGGVWFTAATPAASPNPYANGSVNPNSVVYATVINSPAAPAPFAGLSVMAAMPHFSLLDVGELDANFGFIKDDDQLRVVGPNGAPVAYYIGTQAPFLGAPVQGLSPTIGLKLIANPSGRHQGFAVDISSFLVLTNAPNVAVPSNYEWTSTMTIDGSLDEINVFYHLNKMHDFFVGGVDSSSIAYISNPTVAIVHAGPNLLNAFYNPEFDNLTFGDALGFALDATVPHHEYTHFVVDKIYPVINFGQAGAISEANADYFSGTSLNDSNIAASLAQQSGGDLSPRNLACNPPSIPCQIFPGNWGGEIHDDSRMLSQALWEIRSARGAACSDELAFQTLFYFPDSFEDYFNGILQVSARSAAMAPACGANGSSDSAIKTAFALHFPTLPNAGSGDVYEPNDGPQTATNITTMPVVTATIFPASDIDYYTFGAGPGLIHAVLNLPKNPAVPTTYFAYQLMLFDRQMNPVKPLSGDPPVEPPLDNPTPTGGCPNSTAEIDACRTTSSYVTLDYNNPSANQFYLAVAGGLTDGASNAAVNSQTPYTLHVSYQRANVVGGSIVSASYDNDQIRFTVDVATFTRMQNFSFAYAQLRDQAYGALTQTATNGVNPYMTFVSSSGGSGNITGIVKLTPGFAARYPAVGTVYLEIFGANALQQANAGIPISSFTFQAQSLGFSNPINLTAGQASLTAWNNIVNPLKGDKATFKYEVTSPGHVKLRLYTMSGVLVQTLVDADVPAGKGAVDWFGTNANGQIVASGIYLLHIDGPGISKTQKVAVVK